MLTLEIIKYCAEEVQRQRAYPIDVYHMLVAWEQAMRWREERQRVGNSDLPLALVEEMGRMIEPRKNAGGFRLVNVQVGDALAPEAREVDRLMREWARNLDTMTPAEAYKEFELIHPFRDGNGRTGKIIYNWLHNSLDEPTMPPDFFGGSNP